ncbi:BTAD domain-containing putative transcriptional regulator [Bacillus sp. 31A1R]|uniref:BTAD domain-containing putative transcriptional regulator n=1 Tax=Robertmurraya mangrovi TaxID=3098077 RepID=A0ABU5ISV8_9BACI|nr:BTAD domain-containing putative transcriptional regulator [Bacillus sp. 31A1R]MDZ5470245.1 BTAD domain-containing putative transcriptional regulator [Bacillus sp. 31A1R]
MLVIKTKLIAPKIKEDTIRRAKLTKKMKGIPNHPLTIIHSGAGYGKSTALALYVYDQYSSCCWYSTSATDDDIIPFLTYIISSIQTVYPTFGTEIKSFMNEMDHYIREEDLSSLCSLFVNELLSLEKKITLIIDDYHQVEHSYNINRFMERLLEHIPEQLSMIVSSRSRPLWKPLTKMKVTNQLLEITKEDLSLSMDEIELLLSDNYDLTINEEELKQIYKITEGWVIALGMIAQQIQHTEDIHSFLSKPGGSLQDLFQYLVMEVFSKQPPLIQQFLEQTSVLEELDEDVCDVVLGITGSAGMLEQLLEKNLFIQRIGEKQYRYHALFKEFLEKQFRKNQPHSIRVLHERGARYYEKLRNWEGALLHYEKIGHVEAIASILNDYGITMLESGKVESLYELLINLPNPEKDRFYTLWFLQGEVHRYRSLYKEAEFCYDQAFTGADKKGNALEKSKALEGKAKIYLDTIQPYNAERYLYQAIEIREKSEWSSEQDTGKLYRLLAENLINSGHAIKAEKWLKRARDASVDLGYGNLQARLYLRTGRLDEAKNVLFSARKNHSNGPIISKLPQSHRETDLLLALIEALTGNGVESKSLAQEGIQSGVSSQSPFVEACGWIRMGHAVQLLDQYDLALAEKCYETALEIMDRIRVERGKAEAFMGLCILYGNKGDYERAIEVGILGLQETEKVKDIWLSSLIKLSMGIAAIYNNRLSEASIYLNKAETMFQNCHDEFGKMLTYFWKAYLSFVHEETEQFESYITLFLKQVQLKGFEFIFHKRSIYGPRDLEMFAPLLIEIQKRNIFPDYVTKLLQHKSIANLDSHPGFTLRIQTLGQFRVWLGETEVEERDWQRGKAKELLQLFLTNRKHFFPKEEILQLIWPEQNETSAARDFKVALNALNNALEPHRKPRANPFFIMRDGTSYGINNKAGIELDTVIFEEWIRVGLAEQDIEQSIQCLEKGLRLYKGDYLPDRRYDDWCLNERERLLVYYLRGAEKLAQLSVRKENYDQAIHWCESILKKDKTWEEAYRLIMYCYYRKNNRPYAIKWYQKCCEVLEEELGVSPLEPTRHMYEMIMEMKVNVLD